MPTMGSPDEPRISIKVNLLQAGVLIFWRKHPPNRREATPCPLIFRGGPTNWYR
jgi:hypothetical protein